VYLGVNKMTLAPRFLVNLLARFRVARFARRQKVLARDGAAQELAFAERMAGLDGTELASLHGLSVDTTYAEFRDKVPVHAYEWFEPFIRRMAGGEADVLVRGRCPLFVETAGTSGAAPKLLPAPQAMLTHFRAGLRDTLFFYTQRAGHSGVFLGRHLHLGASIAVNEENGAYRTSFDGILALSLTPWVEANLRSPPAAVATMREGFAKTDAAAHAMLRRDVTLVAGTPGLVSALSQAVRDAASSGKQRATHLQAVWPNLQCCLHTGATLGLFGEGLRATLGPTVKFHEMYAAAEGIFAAQDDGNPTALRVLADAGLFLEFLPQAAYHEATLAHAGPQCVPLAAVETGVNYVLVITTPAGLVRYATGDVVRFVSTTPPRLQFVGRAALQLNAAGEKVTERDVLETLLAVCTRNGWQPIAFHVAPYAQRLGPGQVLNAHEWWLELGTHTMKTPTANVLGPELDTELGRRSADYAARRATGQLGAPLVRLVMPGVFESWATEQKKTASASKLPRCRPDRLIADQLAALAPFHQATIPPFKASDLTA
jgi:hypothetical protein